jgi:hypothetical protein
LNICFEHGSKLKIHKRDTDRAEWEQQERKIPHEGKGREWEETEEV